MSCQFIHSLVMYSYQDPFDDYKKRLAKKLARQAEAEQGIIPVKEKDKKEDMNWFGVKLATGDSILKKGSEGGVGKYLDLKRPRENTAAVVNGTNGMNGTRTVAAVEEDDLKKRRKIGFGSFDTW